MKILQVIPYFYPAVTLGGTVHCVYESSKLLSQRNHEVTIYTTDLLNHNNRLNVSTDTRVTIDGLNTKYFRNINNYLAYNQHIFFPPSFFLSLLKTIKNFDIIHIHEVYTFLSLWTAIVAKLNQVPYVITAHGSSMSVEEAGRIGRKRIFNFFLGRKLLNNAKKIIAITEQEKKSFIKMGISSDKVILIPNGVKIKTFNSTLLRKKIRKKYKINDKTIVILFFGRIHPKKGLDLLFKSLKILLDKKNNVKLLIAGPVENKDYFDKLNREAHKLKFSDNIIYIGEILGDDKYNIFSVSDLFTLPSYSEVLSISALEAAVSGLPLIVSKNCGLAEVEQFEAGKIIETSVNSIVSAIEDLISKKNFRKYYGENAEKMVDANFRIETSVEKLEKLYENILNCNN